MHRMATPMGKNVPVIERVLQCLEDFPRSLSSLYEEQGTHEALSAQTPSYLMVRDLTALPAPDRFEASEEVGILLQGRHEPARSLELLKWEIGPKLPNRAK